MPEADLPEEWRVFDVDGPLTAAEAVRTGGLVVRDVDDAQGPSAVLARMKNVGDATQVMALPLHAGDRALGAISLALETPEPMDEGLRHFLLTLGTQLGQALERAVLHEGEMEAAARIRLLADASSLLGRSLDYRQTIGQVALAAVPGFADWCGVDLLDEHDDLQPWRSLMRTRARWNSRGACAWNTRPTPMPAAARRRLRGRGAANC